MVGDRASNDCIRIGRQKKGAKVSGESAGKNPGIRVGATNKKQAMRCTSTMKNSVWRLYSVRGGYLHGV